MYNENTVNKKLTITEFREHVITAMLERNTTVVPSRRTSQTKHHLIKNVVNNKKVRGRCHHCYQKYGRTGKTIDGKLVRASQVFTRCSVCEIFLCQNCFIATHKVISYYQMDTFLFFYFFVTLYDHLVIFICRNSVDCSVRNGLFG